ncbi:preprotein translocase subunit SecE [Patescibacteria group bacterium]|nr:preprotein translocase subunit SecE [Patescibacteria group bacterium]
MSKLIDYLRSSKNELHKVTWPSREQTVRYSALVIIISLGVAAFFGLLDMGLSRVVSTTLTQSQAAQEVDLPIEAPVVPDTIPLDQVNTEQPTIDFDNVEPITTPDNQ